jgi:hypothetical protein
MQPEVDGGGINLPPGTHRQVLRRRCHLEDCKWECFIDEGLLRIHATTTGRVAFFLLQLQLHVQYIAIDIVNP